MKHEIKTYGTKPKALKLHKAFKSTIRSLFSKPTYTLITEKLSLETYDLHEEEM